MSEQIEISRRVEMVAKAWLRAAIASGRTNDLLASSRALLAQSRQPLAELEDVKPLRMPRQDWLPESVVVNRSEGIPVAPAVHQSDQTSAKHAELSVRVFEDAGQFGWTVYSQANELLGQGTAESELSARVDAFHAGMTYIERLKGRTAPSDTPLH